VNYAYLFLTRLKQNWKSGITVSLVSIPLSISLAIASQTSPLAGIITAVWAGLVAAIFGGSNYNIIGPTGALSGILGTFAIIHGAETLPTLAIVSGFLILLAYLLRLEKFLNYVPGSTIQGFTLGVAFIIAFNQLNFIFGLSGLEKHEHFLDNVKESFLHLSQSSLSSVAVFMAFLAGLFILAKYMKKVPGAIILTPFGIALGYLTTIHLLPFSLETLGSRYGDLQLSLYTAPKFFIDYSVLSAAVTVAVVAILETMISAKIADGMTKTKHKPRKEMFGLGLANIASGIMGGIPATAALARTSVNAKSGATSNVSAIISSISIAVICVFLLSFFKYIPMAVIAAILVFAAVRMIEVHELKSLIRHDRWGLGLALIVFAITIYADPLIGILVGTTISLLIFVNKISQGQYEVTINDHKKGVVKRLTEETELSAIAEHDTLVYSFNGALAYINGHAHVARFSTGLNGYKNVILRLRELHFIDTDGVDALDEIIDLVHEQGKKVLISSINNQVVKVLTRECEGYNDLKKQHLVFKSTEDALAYLKKR
jgi:SulP family sulfate permease